jgi:ketosteroid isomerase-like protein
VARGKPQLLTVSRTKSTIQPGLVEGEGMAHPNEDLIRKGYDAFSVGDMETLRGLIAPNATWHVPGRSPLAGDYEGIDAILNLFAKVFDLSEGTLRLEVHDVLANDEHGVGLQHATAQRGDRTLDSNEVSVFNIQDGMVTEAWLFPADLYAEDEFWS